MASDGPVSDPWYHEGRYRGGWLLQETWKPSTKPGGGDWSRVALRDDLRIEQGLMTYQLFLEALDRIDGRAVLADYIAGLQAGKSAEEASIRAPQEQALARARAQAQGLVLAPDAPLPPVPAEVVPPQAPAPMTLAPRAPSRPQTFALQPSLFDLDGGL